MLLCKLGYTTCFATIAFARFYFGFSDLWLLYYTCSCHAFPLIFYSTSLLLLLYYTMCLSMLATWLSHHHSPGSSDSSGSSCPGFGAWSVWIPPVADQSGAAVAWISSKPFRALTFQAPCVPLEFSFCKLESTFDTVHSCTSLCILAFAPISDVIFL